jgi:hypothetical protein
VASRLSAVVAASPSYRGGSTLVLVTYDVGRGGDSHRNEHCSDKALDMPVSRGRSARQDSCHVPLFVISPSVASGSSDGGFLDDYSITKTVEQLFGLRYLAHAGDRSTGSILGHFGLPAPRPRSGPG